MASASAALRVAIHDALSGDGALTALLGGPKIYDEPPRAAEPPELDRVGLPLFLPSSRRTLRG